MEYLEVVSPYKPELDATFKFQLSSEKYASYQINTLIFSNLFAAELKKTQIPYQQDN